VKALEAFKQAWLIEGTIELLQGSFKMDASGWFCKSFGESYVLAIETFEEESQCETCKKQVPTYKLAEYLDSSDGNIYEMCPTCRTFHRDEFEKELGEECED
jgi:Zn finger protein HypA/HybF involved in hydrogenase expression